MIVASVTRAIARRLALATALVGLDACQQRVKVAVEQSAGVVNVAVTRLAGSKPACLSSVSVYRGQADGGSPLWRIAAAPEAACTTHLRLGTVPPGFAADGGTAAPTFTPGQPYRVEVAGNGFGGTTGFTAGR